ncbi:metallophosphoesterase family protein [Sagittula sp. NFXS13]|uniref:metallophosphoesterase family protein n=1 Tax=Sagittula sp. NFXS13 TaxID=2819095 RepID=UPI0032DE529B
MIGETGGSFAVLADIHGNADALRAVLADIDAQGITQVLNLGDLFSGPLAARETAEILMAREILTIRGNHDRYLLEQTPARMQPSDRVAFEQLEPEHLTWLQSLPATLSLTPDIFLCHGTPRDDTTYWMEHVPPSGVPNRRPLADIAAEAEGIDASLFLCGHTHIPRRLDIGGGRVVFNPGSVGCPGYDDDLPLYHVMETGTPAATYGIVTRTAQGWRTSLAQVPYDPWRMVAMARAADREDWAGAIGTGWVGSLQPLTA